VVTLTLSRAATYGYDQRLEVFGSKGLASLTNPHSNTTQLSNSSGIHLSKLQYSFPQRFELAFSNELDLFADVLLSADDNGGGSTDGGTVVEWPVKEEDCIAVQRICDAALVSCESGEVVLL
jgi:myo-inositol 2-dehydrogenase / D-chiro-inositol 1-dehydrogenase